MKVVMSFWISPDNRPYAQRTSDGGDAPDIGDEVRFQGVIYKISHKIWYYDDQDENGGIYTQQRIGYTMIRIKDE